MTRLRVPTAFLTIIQWFMSGMVKFDFFVTFSPNMGYQSMEQKTIEILDIVIVII